MSILTQSLAWRALQTHQSAMAQVHLRELFKDDPLRANKFSLSFNDILIDYSKQRITGGSIERLLDLARQQNMEAWIARMFSGEKVNSTEYRAALHTALRGNTAVVVDGQDVMPSVKRVLQKMSDFASAVHAGERKGYTGKLFKNIVNIGIGGSDLGSVMVTEALKPYGIPYLKSYFVSNIDGAQLSETLKQLDPAVTLFIIASKTFATQETMVNAHSARKWFLAQGGSEQNIANHFVAISTNRAAVEEFGIHAENMFEFWDWVGGRYSLWSAIGLPIALTVGMDNFNLLLEGAREMDQHFATSPLEKNIPVILGMLGIWQQNFWGVGSHVVLPYDQSLHRFPAYLQQLEMESNGKRITRDGGVVDYSTGTVVWGEPGTNGQHAFYQLLHQGTQKLSIDFLAACQSHHLMDEHHHILLANFFAQSEALMCGKDAGKVENELNNQGMSDELIAQILLHKVFPGNQPSTSILVKKLDPRTLGSLIALYEHKVYVQSVIWNINPFDQWGVELGKQLAQPILAELRQDGDVTTHDSSTNSLINFFKMNK